jgi:putative peptidoglycan lipid II flippase
VPTSPGAGRSAALVAAGILMSRLTGLVRQRVIVHYLGLSDAADVVALSFRIPNLLQNLFGEGALSASFIPVYARLVGQGRDEDAGRVAGAVAGLLALVTAIVVLIGIVAAPLLVVLLAPGFTGEKQLLTITMVRILYPAAGILVLSAWCLGVLNSHRRFLLSYTAPVVWNAAIIVAVLAFRDRAPADVALAIAWGAVAGSLLQVLVQLPLVLSLVRGLRITLAARLADVRTVLGNFGPALMGRGVTQISAYVDGIIASLLGTGAAMAVANAQMLYLLPVGLFGMAVSAAELPAMSAERGSDAERAAALRARLAQGLRRIAFFVVPCAVAFLVVGQAIATVVFQSGRFTAADSRYVWAILAGAAVGLLAATLSRLSSSAFYALGDTRTPLRIALLRVALATLLGFAGALALPRLVGVHVRWGAVGLTTASSIAAWVEFGLLRRRLRARIGGADVPAALLARLLAASLAAGAAGWLVMAGTAPLGATLSSALVLVTFALVYGALTLLLGVDEARALAARVGRRGA